MNLGYPFFSIVIPTYNSSKTLAQCLDTIICQSYKNFEILIIDGLSDDGTVEMLKDYTSHFENIQWISEKDDGIYDALNKGIKMACGEWIYFLGSDDKIYSPSVLLEVSNKNSNQFDVMYGSVRLIGNTSWAKDGDIYDGNFDFKKILSRNICHQAIFYRLKYLKEHIGFYNISYKHCADWDLNLRCWADKPFYYLDIIIADFYGGGTTTANIGDDVFFNELRNNIIKYFGLRKLQQVFSKAELLQLHNYSNRPRKVSLIKRLFVKLKRYFLGMVKGFV